MRRLLTVEAVDRHRPLTGLAIGGLVVAGALALFGLPPVNLHGPLHRYFAIMDPLCGGTRSVHLAARGDLAAAWLYNPLGPVLVLGALGLLARWGIGRMTGRWLTVRWRWTRTTLAVALVLLVALQVNQQRHAGLLM